MVNDATLFVASLFFLLSLPRRMASRGLLCYGGCPPDALLLVNSSGSAWLWLFGRSFRYVRCFTGAILPMSFLVVYPLPAIRIRAFMWNFLCSGAVGAPFNRFRLAMRLSCCRLLSPIELYITPHGVGTWHRIISL